MVHSTRVRRMPTWIISNDRNFIGNTLTILPLRKIIDAKNKGVTEQEVIAIAEKLFAEYQDIYLNNKELWHNIKKNDVETYKHTYMHRIALRRLIRDYKKRKEQRVEHNE